MIMKTSIKPTRITIILITWLLSVLNMTAQYKPDIPPSPQATAFNRLGDYQVNNNYGAPDISIPLFEIDHRGYKIPLTLHYEASPLKSGYNYDVTGLGWTLSGNSCVSRTILDRADENGSFDNPFALDPFYNQSGAMKMYKEYKDKLNEMNFRYDTYSIVLPSGRTIPFFMYKSEGVMKYHLAPSDTAVKISIEKGSGINTIGSFTVKDEKGVVYYFAEVEKSTNLFDDDYNQGINTTWFLTSINIPSKGTIIYTYNSSVDIYTRNTVREPEVTLSRLKSPIYEDYLNVGLHINLDDRYPTQCPRYRMKFLNSIIYGPTTIEFNYLADKRHMSEIVVSDNGEIIKTYKLNYKDSLDDWPLKSLVISGQNETDKFVYSFEYTSHNPGSFTDYWGNRCNFRSSNDIANFNVYVGNIGSDNIYNFWGNYPIHKPEPPLYSHKVKLQSTTNGDTRKPTSPDVHCVLSSITYPNGGKTLFNWENHRFPTATAANGDFVFDRRSQRIIEGGGFRIKSIINKTADGKIISEDHYRYGFTYGDIIQSNFPLPLPESYNLENHIGCGEAVVDPNVLTFMNYSHDTFIGESLEFQRMVVGLNSQFHDICAPQGRGVWWDASFSASTFRSLLGGRRAVVYPEITIYHGNPADSARCIEKTVYKYDIYNNQLPPTYHYLSALLNKITPEIGYFESLYYYNNSVTCSRLRCDEDPAKRHLLKSKSDYSYNAKKNIWELTSEEKYGYLEENISESDGVFMFDCNYSRVPKSYYCQSEDWLSSCELIKFYKQTTQRLGKSTMISKSTTFLRQGGTYSKENTQKDVCLYRYSGAPEYKEYTDVHLNRDWYSYVGDQTDNSDVIKEMKSRNMLAFIRSTETEVYPFENEEASIIISGSKIDYAFFGKKILPSKIYERNGEVYEESVEVLSYDSFGNPTEIVDMKTGQHSVYLWDSYGRYLVAFINNATLSQVGNVSSLLTGTSQTRYVALRTMLPNAQIQTWDYKPLIGVSSFTDVNGQTIRYEYDGLGRLKSEKRIVNGVAEPETLHKYEYNYMNQEP